jgi:hypothetical protein
VNCQGVRRSTVPTHGIYAYAYSEFFLRLAIGFYMIIFQPPVNFCSDKNIQTIFGTKFEDFLNYRIDYDLISQTVEKVVKKYFLGRRNNSTSSGRQSSAIGGSTQGHLNQKATLIRPFQFSIFPYKLCFCDISGGRIRY